MLRAMAIISVVVAHASTHLSPEAAKWSNFFLLEGVSVFFVLSGFLIGGIFIKQFEATPINIKSMMSFWIRRWIRTIPNYLLILLLLIVIFNYKYHTTGTSQLASYFFFTQNLAWPHPSFFAEAWSLCVEEWFYLSLPILVYVLVKTGKLSIRTAIPLVCLLLGGISFYSRYVKYLHLPDLDSMAVDQHIRKQVITRLDNLVFGVLAAFVQYYYYRWWIRYKNPLLLLSGLIYVMIKLNGLVDTGQITFYQVLFHQTDTALLTVFALPFLSEYKTGKGFIYRCITHISLISYSMYLINLSLVQLTIMQYVQWPNFVDSNTISILNYVSFWLLTLLLATLLYRYYEKPIMDMRNKLH